MFTNGGSTIEVYNTTTLQSIPMVAICALWVSFMAHTRGGPNSCSPDHFEWGCYSILKQLSFSHQSMWWSIHLWGLGGVTQSLFLLYMLGMGLLFQVWFHPVTHLTLNLLIAGWWLGIRLMNLLTPGQQSMLLISHTFTLG